MFRQLNYFRRTFSIFYLTVFIFGYIPYSQACLWDYDNLAVTTHPFYLKQMEMQAGWKIDQLEKDLKEEIENAKLFYEKIVADEKAWIAQGKNLDKEFFSKYYEIKDKKVK